MFANFTATIGTPALIGLRVRLGRLLGQA